LPNAEGEYQCTRCKVWKPKGRFSINRYVPSGVQSWCIDCINEQHREKRLLRNADTRNNIALRPLFVRMAMLEISNRVRHCLGERRMRENELFPAGTYRE
jgi:hypothetical protein